MRRKTAAFALGIAFSACLSLTALAAGWSKDGEEYIWVTCSHHLTSYDV